MIATFYECSSLNSFPDISNWNLINLHDISYIFYHCSSLIFLPDISWIFNKFKNNILIIPNDFSLLLNKSTIYFNILSFQMKKHFSFLLDLIFFKKDIIEKISYKLFYFLLFSDFDFMDDVQIDFKIFFNYLLDLHDTSKWTFKTIKDIEYKLQISSYISQSNDLCEEWSNMVSNPKYIFSSKDNSLSLSDSNNNQENTQYSSETNIINLEDDNNSLNNNNNPNYEYYEHFYDSNY